MFDTMVELKWLNLEEFLSCLCPFMSLCAFSLGYFGGKLGAGFFLFQYMHSFHNHSVPALFSGAQFQA